MDQDSDLEKRWRAVAGPKVDPNAHPQWKPGEVWMQGYVGVATLDSVSIDQSGGSPVEIDSSELDHVPFLGGGAQWKLGGDRIDLGLEALLSLAYEADVQAFYFGSGGAAVALDVDTLLLDVSIGPFASVFIGDYIRVYAGVGPILQFLDYDQHESVSGVSKSSIGSGFGSYARAGVEFKAWSNTLVGIGVRYTEGTIQLDNDLGEFDASGYQVFITVTGTQ